MAISLTTLYNRLGKLFGIAKAQVDARSALLDRVKGTGSYTGSGLDAQYDASTRYMISDVLAYFLNLYSSTDSSISNVVQGGVKTLTEMITADNPAVSKSTNAAMIELNRQMRAATQSLKGNTVSVTGSAVSGTGTGYVMFCQPYSQMSASETIRIECVSDVTTGATAGRETFSVRGSQRVTDIGSSLWPGGSGSNVNRVSTDFTDSQNKVVNGMFSSWTGGVPDSWTIDTGAANISQLITGTFRTSSNMKTTIAAAGTSVSIRQTLPPVTVAPGQRILFGVYAKQISGTCGNVNLFLMDAVTNATLAYKYFDGGDFAGSDWEWWYTSVQLPYSAPPTSMYVLLTVDAPSSGTAVTGFSALGCFLPQQCGVNGQFLQIYSGNTNWRIGDYITLTVTNNNASKVLEYTEKFFSPFANGIELPTVAGGGTITDSVIP